MGPEIRPTLVQIIQGKIEDNSPQATKLVQEQIKTMVDAQRPWYISWAFKFGCMTDGFAEVVARSMNIAQVRGFYSDKASGLKYYSRPFSSRIKWKFRPDRIRLENKLRECGLPEY